MTEQGERRLAMAKDYPVQQLGARRFNTERAIQVFTFGVHSADSMPVLKWVDLRSTKAELEVERAEIEEPKRQALA